MDPEKEKRFRFQMQYEQEQAQSQGGEELQQQPPQDSLLNRVAGVISSTMGFIDNPGAMGITQSTPVNTLQPKAQDMFNRWGGNVSEYLGGKNLPGNPYTGAAVGTAVSMLNPENWVSPRTPVKAPGTGIAEGLAQNMGRRALGFHKTAIKRLPGGVGQANSIAQDMLDQGVVGLKSPESMLESAQGVAQRSGQAIGATLKKAGSKALDTKTTVSDINSQLRPEYGGTIERSFVKPPASKVPLFTEKKLPEGHYAAEKAIVDQIENTAKAHGIGNIDFESAQALKETFGQHAKFNRVTDALKAYYNRRAYGIVNKGIEQGLENAASSGIIPQSDIPAYIQNKKIYGSASQAIGTLTDRSAGEAANNIVSLRGALAAAGAAATGDIPKALAGLGIWEVGRRFGEGGIASLANKAAKVTISPTAIQTAIMGSNMRNNAYSAYVDRVTTKQ